MSSIILDSNNKILLVNDKVLTGNPDIGDPNLSGVYGWYKISKDLNEVDYAGNPATVSIWQDTLPRQPLNISFVAGSKISYTGALLNDCIKFDNAALLPPELFPNMRYFVLAVTSNQAQISLTRGGLAITFTDGYSAVIGREYNYLYQSVELSKPVLSVSLINGYPSLSTGYLTLNKNITNCKYYIVGKGLSNIAASNPFISYPQSNLYIMWHISGYVVEYVPMAPNVYYLEDIYLKNVYYLSGYSPATAYIGVNKSMIINIVYDLLISSNNITLGASLLYLTDTYLSELFLFNNAIANASILTNLQHYSKTKFNY